MQTTERSVRKERHRIAGMGFGHDASEDGIDAVCRFRFMPELARQSAEVEPLRIRNISAPERREKNAIRRRK